MTKKFEVGDKVRLTETMTYDRIFDVGHVGTIVGLSCDASYRRVQYEGDTHDWRLVNVSAIEPVVEDKRKFEVGDRVRLTASGAASLNGRGVKCEKGDVGTINRGDNTCIPYRIEFADRRHGHTGRANFWMTQDELELIAPVASTPSPKFNAGDRVRFGGGLASVVTIRISRDFIRYDILLDNGRVTIVGESQIALHTPRTWSKPDATTSLGFDVIDPLVDEMAKALRAHGGDCETRRFGDVMIVVENGQAKIYRLEANSDVE